MTLLDDLEEVSRFLDEPDEHPKLAARLRVGAARLRDEMAYQARLADEDGGNDYAVAAHCVLLRINAGPAPAATPTTPLPDCTCTPYRGRDVHDASCPQMEAPDKKKREPGCRCHREEGDSECPVRREDCRLAAFLAPSPGVSGTVGEVCGNKVHCRRHVPPGDECTCWCACDMGPHIPSGVASSNRMCAQCGKEGRPAAPPAVDPVEAVLAVPCPVCGMEKWPCFAVGDSKMVHLGRVRAAGPTKGTR